MESSKSSQFGHMHSFSIGAVLRQIAAQCASIGEKIPLIRALFLARYSDYMAAKIEFSVVWVASIMPIGISVLIDYITRDSVKNHRVLTDGWQGFVDRVSLNLNGGEIFIYIISFLGTVAFVLYKYNRMSRSFPDFWTVVGLGGGMAVVSAVIFGLQRSHEVEDKELVNFLAWVMYLFTLFLFFVALLYEQLRTKSFGSQLRLGETTLQNELSGYKPS